jgi:hypothetical protein
MIGTTVKVGFDATSVRSGLAGIGKQFGSFGRQVGIGMARQVGARATDMIGRIIGAVPEATSELLDYAGRMNDLSAQTKESVKDLMVLEEAMRLGGAGEDASRMIYNLQKNLQSAGKEAGPIQDAFNELTGQLAGKARQMAGMPVTEQIQEIFSYARNSGKSVGELNDLLGQLFGGKMNMKMMRLLENFDETLLQAGRNVGGFADDLNKTASALDDIGDELGRFTMLRRELTFSFLRGLFGPEFKTTIARDITGLFQSLKPIAEGLGTMISPVIEMLSAGMKKLQNTIDYAKSEGLGIGDIIMQALSGTMDKLGEQFGAGIKRSLPRILGGEGSKPDDRTSSLDKSMLDVNKRQVELLDRIYREKGTPMFA